MINEIYIDNKLCELDGDTKIAVTLQMVDINNSLAVRGNYTNRVKLPKTKKNTEIIENADIINSDTDKPYNKLPFRWVRNGLEMLHDGYCILEQYDGNAYDVVGYGGNVDFFDLLKNKKLSDLDLSDLDHVWNFSNIISSFTNTEGYIYPLIDWEQGLSGFMPKDLRETWATTLQPCVYVKTLVSRIIEGVGYNEGGNILNTTLYNKLLLSIVNGGGEKDAYDYGVSLQKTNGQLIINTTYEFGNSINFETVIKDVFSQTIGNVYYKAPYDCVVTIRFKIYYLEGGTGVKELNIVKIQTVSGDAQSIYNVQLVGNGIVEDSLTVELKKDDLIYILGKNPSADNLYIFQNSEFEVIVDEIKKGFSNDKMLTLADKLGDMQQIDFLKNIARIFGCIFETNTFTKTLSFRQFKEIYNNITNALDWSEKLDLSKPISVGYHSDFAQKNLLKWNNDTEKGVPEKLGESSIDVSDSTLDNEKVFIEVGFSASEMQTKLIDLQAPKVRWLKNGAIEGTVKQRMFIADVQDVAEAIKFNDLFSLTTQNVSTSIPLCYFQLDSKTENLGFDNSLKSDNYSEFEFMLNKYKRLECYVRLDDVNIFDFDYFRPVYIDYFKSYFIVNKINNYTGDSASYKVELIRL